MKKLIVIVMCMILVTVLGSTSFADLNNGLVAYFPFNGNANDLSGNGHNGTVFGAVLTTDRFGNANSAYSFDGVNDYIDLSNTAGLNFTSGGFTLAAWVKFTADNNDDAIIGKHINGYWNGYFLGAGNIGGPANVFNFYVSNDPRSITTETYNDGNYHFVAGSYDGAYQYLYVDGVLKSSRQNTYTTTNNINISIGRHSAQSDIYGGYFSGVIDDVRIYNRSLSASEIQQLTVVPEPISAGLFLLGGIVVVVRYFWNKRRATACVQRGYLKWSSY